MAPRYPDIRVELHSRNPYAAVSAVRTALRRSRIDAQEIDRFTDQAMAANEPQHVHAVCSSWAQVHIV